MVLAVFIAGGTGVALGLRLRVPAILFASAVALIAGIALTRVVDWSLIGSLIYCVGLLTALQIGFLAGGALSCVRSRRERINVSATGTS
jgi:hypothetical protein